MKTTMTSLLAAAAICLCAASSLQAQTAGYVDIERVTAKAKMVSKAVQDLSAQLQDMQKKITDKERMASELDAQLKRDTGVLAKDIVEQKRKELLTLEDELDALQRDSKQKMRFLETDTFGPLKKEIQGAIEEVAKARKIDVVVNGETVLYGTTAADLTNDVIAKLNGTTAAAVAAEAKKDAEEQAAKPAETSEKATSGKSAASPKSDIQLVGEDDSEGTSTAKINSVSVSIDAEAPLTGSSSTVKE
ncbi:OmpH family outer membrane protein [Candidatus Sumerlaeota bacterium]|nr:OmpH family outer membrane protein [Candidatus Sumerlaeales bacterium]NLD61472.1 OmpH family outer membrane protein [Candidatus Sumerlaeota bacterium]